MEKTHRSRLGNAAWGKASLRRQRPAFSYSGRCLTKRANTEPRENAYLGKQSRVSAATLEVWDFPRHVPNQPRQPRRRFKRSVAPDPKGITSAVLSLHPFYSTHSIDGPLFHPFFAAEFAAAQGGQRTRAVTCTGILFEISTISSTLA